MLEQVEHAPERMIDHVVERFRLRIERRHRRIDDRARLGHRRHAADMAEMQRRFAQHQHDAARAPSARRRRRARSGSAVTPVAISAIVLIEHGAITMPRCVERSARAGRARCRCSACTTSASASTSATFRLVSAASVVCPAREMIRCVSMLGRTQQFEQPDAIDRAGRAGDPDDQALRLCCVGARHGGTSSRTFAKSRHVRGRHAEMAVQHARHSRSARPASRGTRSGRTK